MLVEEVETDKGPVVELVVEHEDLGKVIGRSGRVAQALRTLVRASAEGRISIDIISFEDEVLEGEAEHAPQLTAAAATRRCDGDDAGEATIGAGRRGSRRRVTRTPAAWPAFSGCAAS